MGIFKTEEEKAAKAQAKIDKIMTKYHLQDVSQEYKEHIIDINQELAGIGLMEAGFTLGMGYKPEDKVKAAYLHAIFEQNWIIIRLLDKIANK